MMSIKKHYIEVPKDKWGLLFVYDFDVFDADELEAIMGTFGMPDEEIPKAVRILLGVNTGLTISRSDVKMSVMFISHASSVSQFADTVVHEIDHVQTAICEYYDVPLGGEDAAWTQGYLARCIAEAISEDAAV